MNQKKKAVSFIYYVQISRKLQLRSDWVKNPIPLFKKSGLRLRDNVYLDNGVFPARVLVVRPARGVGLSQAEKAPRQLLLAFLHLISAKSCAAAYFDITPSMFYNGHLKF